MSNETDTALHIACDSQLINTYLSVDSCKECKELTMYNNTPVCGNETPTIDNCNVLKEHNIN